MQTFNGRRTGFMVQNRLRDSPAKSPPAFKGFGPAPSKPKAKKTAPPQSQSRHKHSARLNPRGGSPNLYRRIETAEDAQMKIRKRAENLSGRAETLDRSESRVVTDLRTPGEADNTDATYGPRGLLLVGFEESDYQAVTEWFSQMEPGFQVSCCTDELLPMPLGEALVESDGTFRKRPRWLKPVELVPHAAIFSGMTHDEYFGIVQYWEETGIKQPVFASAAEASAEKPLRGVLLEISKAYARSMRTPDEQDTATRDSLRKILKERMEAKARGEDVSGPAFL